MRGFSPIPGTTSLFVESEYLYREMYRKQFIVMLLALIHTIHSTAGPGKQGILRKSLLTRLKSSPVLTKEEVVSRARVPVSVSAPTSKEVKGKPISPRAHPAPVMDTSFSMTPPAPVPTAPYQSVVVDAQSSSTPIAAELISDNVENESASHITPVLFDSMEISANTKKAITEVLKYANMTVVQQQSMPVILAGHDVFVKARTGTGKTIGFLVPAIDNLINELKNHAKHSRANERQGTTAKLPRPVIFVISPVNSHPHSLLSVLLNIGS